MYKILFNKSTIEARHYRELLQRLHAHAFLSTQSTKNMHHNPINGHHACPRVCREGPLLIQLTTKNRQRFNLNLTEPQNRNLKRLNDLNDLVQFNSAFMLGFYNQNDFGLVWFGV